jgi:hypothetical protein
LISAFLNNIVGLCSKQMEGHGLRVLRRIFGPKKDRVTEEWKKTL